MNDQNNPVGTFTISWDENLGIGRCVVIGETDENVAKGMVEECGKLMAQHPSNFLWLADLSKNTKLNSNARKILAQLSGDSKIKKIAFVGASIPIRVVANFIVAASGKNNSKHFGTEDEAVKWLKE